MESVDSLNNVHGQWTKSREFGKTGQCPWTLSTESLDKVHGTADNVHGLAGQSAGYSEHCPVYH